MKAIAAQFSLPLTRHYGRITGNSRKYPAFLAATTKAEEEYGKQPLDSTTVQDYDQKLDATLNDLQDKVKRQDDDLQVCPETEISQEEEH